MDSKDEPVPNANQRPASKLHVHVQGKPDHMAVGTKNTIVFFRATSKDDDTNNNNIQSGVTSDIVILSEKNEVKCKYKSNPGESTIITIGNNCDIVEIAINPDLEQKLKEAGEFQVTKGDKLVSIRWKNDDNWSNDEEAYCEWKIRFTKDGKKVDTLKLEKEIFEKMVDENNNDLRDLVTELITIYNAKLQHIESGCIQLVLSTQSPEDARRLEKQKDELKALLHRTIIPESIEIDLEFQSTDSSQEQDGLDKENPVSGEHKMLPKDGQISLEDDPLSDTEVEKVNIQDEIVKPQRAGRVLSQFIKLEPVSGNMFDSNQKERVLIEKRSMKRTVGSGPQIQQFKEVNPPNFEAMTARELWSSRQLMSPNSEPIRSPENVDIRVPRKDESYFDFD
ncbi:hypothetical protein LOTGIDRAFT_235085 [Lottia gigantea]|uniref:Uncharacterized protein n=1 Tax=Lottia gigantea TaxID=225164 RepID=V4BEZ5_LOTGI|nr:hypothetical protein LOTGIDRAFT_235085 [Lottia gigantea]ESO87409.1 hypothetical protein LOTGIDRAFT_235085 [Lottia gigantea]